jgi:threonylcarbamoyladenosine tRNA methylthiotransferase MtaB
VAVQAARALEQHGYHEIVLTGVLLGSYGRDLASEPNLAALIEALLNQTSQLRIRISSIEPQDLDPAWFGLWDDRRLCRHLHVPLQSGSDGILRAMRRHYCAAEYARLVDRARAAIPDLAVTTDLLVGFPGEAEAQFEETVVFSRQMAYAGMHVFRYSARPGTPAARMTDQVADSIKAERSERVREMAREGSARFHRRFIGTTQEVLWEHATGDIWHGLTDNHLHVSARSQSDLHNKLTMSALSEGNDQCLWAAGDPISASRSVRL